MNTPPDKPQTASEASFLRYDEMRHALTRQSLAESSILTQAEIIADHYLKSTEIAMKLKEIVNLAKFTNLQPSTLRMIESTLADFKQLHADDFGIKLEWKGEQDER